MTGLSLTSLTEDLKFAMPYLRKFAKKAMGTDKSGGVTLGEIGDIFFPSIELKAFMFDEKKDALNWIQA